MLLADRAFDAVGSHIVRRTAQWACRCWAESGASGNLQIAVKLDTGSFNWALGFRKRSTSLDRWTASIGLDDCVDELSCPPIIFGVGISLDMIVEINTLPVVLSGAVRILKRAAYNKDYRG